MASAVSGVLRRPTLRSHGSSTASAASSSSSSKSVLSVQSHASTSTNRTASSQPAPAIHPDVLPCLKRQQLENLCVRAGVKSTGKKAELIARLEAFATGQQASKDGRDEVAEEAGKVHATSGASFDDNDKENHHNHALTADIDQEMHLPHESMSIRVIRSVRDSVKGSRRDSVAEDTGAGIVMPSSGTRGSLFGNVQDEEMPSKSIEAQEQTSASCSLTKGDVAAQKKKAKIGPGKSAERPRQPSGGLMPKVRSVSGKLVRIISGHSLADTDGKNEDHKIQQTASEKAQDTSSPERSKRKRSLDAEEPSKMAVFSSLKSREEEEQPVRHALSPQRTIKPRPSRAVARKEAPSTATLADQGSTSPAVTAPSRAFTFTVPRSPEAKTGEVATISTTLIDDDEAMAKVLAEMQARMARNGRGATASNESLKSKSRQDNGSAIASPLKSMDERTRGRFSSQHDKHFGQMDSIANHYAARRATQAATEPKADDSEQLNSIAAACVEKRDGDDCTSVAAKRQRTECTKTQAVKCAPQQAITDSAARSADERAAIRRKLERTRERRKSATATQNGIASARRKSQSSVSASKGSAATPTAGHLAGGFAHRIGHAVRGLVKTNTTTRNKPLPAAPISSSSLSQSPSKSLQSSAKCQQGAGKTASKPVFDLQASLARKPKGYTPYSAKQTAELLSIEAQSSPRATKGAVHGAQEKPSPIHEGWTYLPTPVKEIDKSQLPFPKEVIVSPPRSMRATPSKKVASAAARKSRSSISQTARASLRGSGSATNSSGIQRPTAGPSAALLARRNQVSARAASGLTRTSDGVTRPRAVGLRPGNASVPARSHQRRPSGVPRLSSTPGKKKTLLLPPRVPASHPTPTLSSTTVRKQTIVPSPRPGLPSPVRRVSGRGRGKPSVRPVERDSMELDGSHHAAAAAVLAEHQ